MYFTTFPTKTTQQFSEFAWSLLFILVYTLIFGLIFLNSQITRSAHSTRKYFYGYLNSTSLPIKRRMKIMAFMEKLCGPDIGFYCWDWFPLNFFEFYQYCAFCASFYMMVVGFLSWWIFWWKCVYNSVLIECYLFSLLYFEFFSNIYFPNKISTFKPIFDIFESLYNPLPCNFASTFSDQNQAKI